MGILKKRQIALDGKMKLRQAKKGNAMGAKEKLEAERQKLMDEDARKREHNRQLEDKRTHAELEREKKRNMEIKTAVQLIQEDHVLIQREKKEAKARIIEEKRMQDQLDARKRTQARSKKLEDLEMRERKAQQRLEEREKKVKEQEWLRKHDDEQNVKKANLQKMAEMMNEA